MKVWGEFSQPKKHIQAPSPIQAMSAGAGAGVGAGAGAPVAIDENLYSRQLGVFGHETYVTAVMGRRGVWVCVGVWVHVAKGFVV